MPRARKNRVRDTVRWVQVYNTVVTGTEQYNDIVAPTGGALSATRLTDLVGLFSRFRMHSLTGRFLKAVSANEYGAIGYIQGDEQSGLDLDTLALVSQCDKFVMAFDGQTIPAVFRLSRRDLMGTQPWYKTGIVGDIGRLYVCAHNGGTATADVLAVQWELDIEFDGDVPPSASLSRHVGEEEAKDDTVVVHPEACGCVGLRTTDRTPRSTPH
jgi:hypothetical protein